MVDSAEREEGLENVAGLRLLGRLEPLLARLRAGSCQARDRAGNRRLFFDHVGSLILLTFFNPTITTMRDLQRASRLKKVREKLGCKTTSLGSLSEAMHLFDPELLVEIIQELLGQIPASPAADPRLKELAHVPTAVDGTFLRYLPQVTQACFATRRDQGWKMHAHFEILRGVPTVARVTPGHGKGAAGERAVLRSSLQADRCYVTDRGYEEFSLFNAVVAAGSSYVCRVRKDHGFTVDQARELSEEARAAEVLSDEVGRMGSPKSKGIEHPNHLQRRVVVRVQPHQRRKRRRDVAAEHELVLITSLLEVPVEVIVLLYRFRWLIELFFRWLKCVLSCRHLLSQSANGIQIQMYCALIACLLIQVTAGDVKPNQWTYKLLCLYQQGWATEEEVLDHLRERREAAKKIS